MLWVDSSDPKDWKYKRRHTVLGMWRELKLQMWQQYLDAIDGEEQERAAATVRENCPF
jgi:hypothetical protein